MLKICENLSNPVPIPSDLKRPLFLKIHLLQKVITRKNLSEKTSFTLKSRNR